MKVSTMRRVDEWIGVPLSFLATGLRALLGSLSPASIPEGKPRSILIIKLSELGALVTLGPALRSLTLLAGRERLYFLTFAESRALLEVLDYVPRENIFVLPTDSLLKLIRHSATVLIRIRRLKIDCSVDLDFFSRATALLGLFSGCRRRVGCHAFFGEGPYRGNLLTHRVKFNPHLHVSQMFEILAKAVDRPAADFPRIDFVPCPIEAPRDRFRPTPRELEEVQRMVEWVGAGSRDRLVLLNSNISDREMIPLRKWSDDRYIELAGMILDGVPDSFVLLTGGAKEAESIAKLEASVGRQRCRSVAGKTTLRQLLTLYAISALLVTNDSGPAHFATLTDIEVVVLFGPESPMLWRPLGDRVQVIYQGLACSPCFSVYNGRQSMCRRNLCMEIEAETVYATVRERLATPHCG